MKKCPKCGTILDDSKKKCYMCGADLTEKKSTSLSDIFDSSMNTTVSNSSLNFSFPEAFSKKASNNLNDNSNTDTGAKTEMDFGHSHQNNTNGFSAPVVPVLTNNQETINESPKIKVEDKPKKKNKSTKTKKTSSEGESQNYNPGPIPNENRFLNPTINNQNIAPEPPSQNSFFPEINWGNNIPSNQKTVKKRKHSSFHLSSSFVFNTICFLIAAGLLILGYFLFIKKSDTEDSGLTELGELSFKIDDSFKLESEDEISKYYTRGGTCAIKITTGEAQDGFIDNYFEQIKEDYLKTGDYNTQNETYKINGNTWSSLSIIEFVENKTSSSGMSPVNKYQYVSIVYNDNYYNIVYFNDNNDSTCASGYSSLLDTLEFKE